MDDQMVNKKRKKLATKGEIVGLLEEYRSLRDEIHAAQGRRIQTLSFTIGAFGVILTLITNTVLGSGITSPEARFVIAIGGSITLYGIVIPSLIMNLSVQQTIQVIGSYIRVFIEPEVPGLNWENRWQAHKHEYRLTSGLRRISAIYFFLSLLPLLLPIYMLSQQTQNRLFILGLIPFACWSIYLSYDMNAAISKRWKAQWKSNDEANST